MEFIKARQHPFQEEFKKRRIGICGLFGHLFSAYIKQGKISVDMLIIKPGLSKWGIPESICLKQGCFKHSAYATISIPERMYEFIIQMD